MTQKDKIQRMTREELAQLIFLAENGEIVPKRKECRKISCVICDKNLKCYKDYLDTEV